MPPHAARGKIGICCLFVLAQFEGMACHNRRVTKQEPETADQLIVIESTAMKQTEMNPGAQFSFILLKLNLGPYLVKPFYYI